MENSNEKNKLIDILCGKNIAANCLSGHTEESRTGLIIEFLDKYKIKGLNEANVNQLNEFLIDKKIR